tara:strand:+ start:182 stop:313 length:132 start_codon:yes stop_codon:yes gene_type:complete
MAEFELKEPVRDGFLSGLGVIMAVLMTALIFTVCYVFYLTFLV